MEEAQEPKFDPRKESKEEKFKRLAEPRVNNALDKIRLIGNLASSQYSFTNEQVEKIIESLSTATAELEDKFQKVMDRKSGKSFKL